MRNGSRLDYPVRAFTVLPHMERPFMQVLLPGEFSEVRITASTGWSLTADSVRQKL